jgi:hypothetical protein
VPDVYYTQSIFLSIFGVKLSLAQSESLSLLHTLNHVATKAAPNTAYQNWYGNKPDVSNLCIFGSTAYIHVPKAERKKLDSKSQKSYFAVYSTTQKAYRFC